MQTYKSLLFVFQSAPYDDCKAQEGLEALFAARIFDVPCSVVFVGEGIWQLQPGQIAQGKKSIEKMLSSFPMYDLDQVHVHQASIESARIDTSKLLLDPHTIDDGELRALMHQHEHCLSF